MWDVRMWNEFVWIRIGPVVDTCEHGNEPSGSVKGREFID
jgi:hypothetical protein